ncbi:hypothetical protein DUHN55_38330 [Helicobacter pylori]
MTLTEGIEDIGEEPPVVGGPGEELGIGHRPSLSGALDKRNPPFARVWNSCEERISRVTRKS